MWTWIKLGWTILGQILGLIERKQEADRTQRDRQAGAAIAEAQGSRETDIALQGALRARDDVTDDEEEIVNDPDNRA